MYSRQDSGYATFLRTHMFLTMRIDISFIKAFYIEMMSLIFLNSFFNVYVTKLIEIVKWYNVHIALPNVIVT